MTTEQLTPDSQLPVPIAEIIDRLIRNAEYVTQGNSYNGIEWRDPRPMPNWEFVLREVEDWLYYSKQIDWDGIREALAGVVAFGMQTDNANAFALLNATLIGYKNPILLETALKGIKTGMPRDAEFFEETIRYVNQALSECNFEFTI